VTWRRRCVSCAETRGQIRAKAGKLVLDAAKRNSRRAVSLNAGAPAARHTPADAPESSSTAPDTPAAARTWPHAVRRQAGSARDRLARVDLAKAVTSLARLAGDRMRAVVETHHLREPARACAVRVDHPARGHAVDTKPRVQLAIRRALFDSISSTHAGRASHRGRQIVLVLLAKEPLVYDVKELVLERVGRAGRSR